MKNKAAAASPVGVILTFLFFAGLGVSMWANGGLAFNPGALSAKSQPGVLLNSFQSHADFEKQCSLCHQPLKTTQSRLCLDCHKDVDQEVASKSGVHGRLEASDCAVCHPDHRGRDFDPTRASFNRYDHSNTGFSLVWHQLGYDTAPMDCSACHSMQEPGLPVRDQSCASCHAGHNAAFVNQHTRDFGPACLACHDGVDRMKQFNHQAAAFPLEGKHAQVSCDGCHKEQAAAVPSADQKIDWQTARLNFVRASTVCSACHSEPDLHKGQFPSSCEQCHTPAGWSPATLDGQVFNHMQKTGFSLAKHGKDYAGALLTCIACHPSSLNTFDPATCASCHSAHDTPFMQKHQQDFGPACTGCHDGVDRMKNFDHAAVFPLSGKHAQVECAQCHQNQVFRSTPTDCAGCHSEPAIHAGVFGIQCQDCHTTTAWTPAFLKNHRFPLDHGKQGKAACTLCHTTSYTQYTCYGCHEHNQQEMIKKHDEVNLGGKPLEECTRCHADGTKEDR